MSKKDLLEKCTELGIKISQSSSKEKIMELIGQKEKPETFFIPDNGDKIKYVYHISDIHIRYIERHQEYREVFENLYKTLNRENSIIVICGDIFHNRDRFVSETIVIFDEFIKKLTSIFPVFIIIGNHDCFNHADRMDSVSGIVDIAKYKNLHLLKSTGIYNYSNIKFYVKSLLDIKPLPKVERADDGITHIALYHGIVNGCVLDNGLEIKDAMVISDYDIVMLGDVHKRQYLNSNKTIAYPGSLIQQSFKEELYHGYLLWDLENLSSSFVKVDNDYSYIDIPIGLDLKSIKFTRFSRVRLFIEDTNTETEIEETIEKIKDLTSIISIKKILNPPTLEKSHCDEEIYEKKISGKETNIIKSLAGENWEKILEINQEVSRTVDYEETFNEESLPWVISKIEFMNIFSYGGDVLNTIDIKNGVTGILADNASGKTNILNTILYGLFGNIHSRAQNHLNKNIISRYADKKDLFVKLHVDFLDGRKYYIERTAKTKSRSRIKSSDHGQIDLIESLKFYTDDEILTLGGKTDTEKLLRDVLSFKTKDEFILTNMMSNIGYGQNMSIISMNGQQLDEVFNNIFNLNKYKFLHLESKNIVKKLNEELKVNYTKIEMLKDNLSNLNRDNITSKINIIEDEILDLETKISITKENIKKIDEKLLKSKKILSNEDEKSLLVKKTDCVEILKECDDIQEILKNEEKIKLEYEMLKKKFDRNMMKFKEPFIEIDSQPDEIQTKISILESSRKVIEFNSDFTNEYINAKRYISKMSKDTLDISEIIASLKQLEKIKDGYFIDEKAYDKMLKDLEKTYIDPNLVLKYKQIIKDKEEQDKKVIENINLDQEINRLKKHLKDINVQIQYNIRCKLNDFSAKLEYIDYFYELEEINHKLSRLKENKDISILLTKKAKFTDELERLLEDHNKKDKTLYGLNQDLNNYNTISKKLSTILPLTENLNDKIKLYKIYSDITHSKNLPKMMISNLISSICKQANILIYNTTGLLCFIEQNEKWEIVIKKGDLILGPEHCSGYERFILNTSLKIAFDKYKQLSSIQMFLIDETIDCVSESNFDQIDIVLNHLVSHYKNIILISHNEDLKKKINNRILIDVGKYSKIQKN